MGDEPKRRQSGDHPAVKAYRAKMESISEGTLPQIEALNARLDRLRGKSDPPKTDPRREPEPDPRNDEGLQVDIVELEPDPFPSVPPSAKKKA